VLAHFENKYLGGRSIGGYFDLVTGTSTGGIIALGLGAGLTAAELAHLYIARGFEIFPPPGRVARLWRRVSLYIKHRYDRQALQAMLTEKLGGRRVRDSLVRLCIPALEGRHGEVNIYKTPHHPDYYLDGAKQMLMVALATSAAPTYFQPLVNGGHILVDGGVWANNPIMIGLVDALTCFELTRTDVQILSLGGGLLAWRDLIFTAMRLQSQNALGQARLLVGPENIFRIDCPELTPPIDLDDWTLAKEQLPELAKGAARQWEARVAHFFSAPAADWRREQNLELTADVTHAVNAEHAHIG
jgi:hypothetical protein